MKVIVIGAGVVGVSIAARLAQSGAEVTLVDQAAPGSGTSSTSYAWVNSNGKEPVAYYELNLAGLEAHERLSPQGEDGWLCTGGHVEIAIDEHHRADLAARIERHSKRDYGVEIIDVDRARELLPDVRIPEDAKMIVHYTREGYAYPLKYLAHMLGEARKAGATVRTGEGSAVVGLRAADGGAAVDLADGTTLRADRIVSAAGRWTARLAALASVVVPVREFTEPGDIVVGYLAVTNPLPVRLSRLVTSPWLNVRPAGGGRLMLQALDLDATADPGNVPGPDSELARTFEERLKALIANTEAVQIEQIVVGQRVMPDDGRTIVGPAPNLPWLYVVATHSGVTLAPYLGDAVAAEIMGERQELFDEFRLERFMQDSTFGQPYAPRKPGQQ
ncbi:NAD(P)/FAD-dependent oxidoreductase [Roseitranquillus sediminis]|uniref:NAD(P)/FAD-dependent oxidoreductase n=1 Tax=Roseitranquillus sediminis TaxID=2809051 RepID=UPI001D0C9F0A|nr:FAD-dependent oxidoreductase [Roseitranquillus sediminis]MBM9593163.1 FAD-binding oxidoreductase [Roseitranquillus sediminis]